MTKPLSVHFYLTNDQNMRKVNQKVFNKTSRTDVISIPLYDNKSEKEVVGEIIVNQLAVSENAKRFKVTYQEELARVVCHGVLHLLGYRDDTEKGRQSMQAIEDIIVSEIK